MKLRFGIGKRVGPFYIGATFGGKKKRKAPKPRSVSHSSSQNRVPKRRCWEFPIFWYILAGLFVLTIPVGISSSIKEGFTGENIVSLLLCAALAYWFFRIARKKQSIAAVDAPAAEQPAFQEAAAVNPVVANSLSEVDQMEGHQFEYWCADLLRQNGFLDVEVTPGSGDQGVDVLAVKDGVRYAIQCKCYSSQLGNKPIQEVNTGKTIYHCQIGAVMTNQTFTPGAKAAADATGVLLWDREQLHKMMDAGE